MIRRGQTHRHPPQSQLHFNKYFTKLKQAFYNEELPYRQIITEVNKQKQNVHAKY